MFLFTDSGRPIGQVRRVEGLAHTESIHAAYRELDAAFRGCDYPAYLLLLAANHETIHPDERRVDRLLLERAVFPFDGLRYRESEHTPVRIVFGPTGCTVLAERHAQIVLAGSSLEEELLLQDLWQPTEGRWRLRRRIVLRQRHRAAGHFTLQEHPLFCQFGFCRTDKTTWKETRTRNSARGQSL